MKITGVRLKESAILSSESVQRGLEDLAGSIAKQANSNSDAPIGIGWFRPDEKRVRIGPRGAAAIVVEFGGRSHQARRPVKRALDAHEIR
jgi:hypothetical protein